LKPEDVLKSPVMTEVAGRLIETENTLLFVVDMKATKHDIKRAVEFSYDVKVVKVNTLITHKNEKKAYIKLHPESKAVDVAIKLGII
jgi:ribosomal protein uL23